MLSRIATDLYCKRKEGSESVILYCSVQVLFSIGEWVFFRNAVGAMHKYSNEKLL